MNITEINWTAVVKIGQLAVTPAVLEAVPVPELMTALRRHMRCDWGDVCEADRKENDRALRNGERLLSSYRAKNGTKFWIITEADRSVTTILLPEDY